MLNDTIHRVPEDYMAMGVKRAKHVYNGFELQIEAVRQARPDTTNTQAKNRVAMNLEANIRKSHEGYGLGQYLAPKELAKMNHGQVVVSTTVHGRKFDIPLTVTASGVYSSDVSRVTHNSLREAVTHVMDGVFSYLGVQNDAKMDRQLSQRSQPAFTPAYSPAPSMRM